MSDRALTNGGIPVELKAGKGSDLSNNGSPRVFPIPNDNREKVKTLDDLALSDLALDQFPVVKEWRRRLFDPERRRPKVV